MDRHKLVRGPLCIYIFYLFAVFDLYLVLLVQASYCLYIYTAKNFEKNNTVLTCSLERRSISKRSLHREFSKINSKSSSSRTKAHGFFSEAVNNEVEVLFDIFKSIFYGRNICVVVLLQRTSSLFYSRQFQYLQNSS